MHFTYKKMLDKPDGAFAATEVANAPKILLYHVADILSSDFFVSVRIFFS